MKKILLILCLLTTIRVAGQDRTTMGTDFWVSYLYFTYDYYAPQYSVTLHAFASAPRACTVTATNPNSSFYTTFSVTPGQVTHIDIPFESGCTSSSGTVTPTAIHFTSTDTISLYLIMLGHNNLEITNALPTEQLGSDYLVQCYPSKPSTDYRSEIVIVAAEDSTVVDFTLTAPTMNGFTAGSTHTITLQQGDAYQIRGATNINEADLTGTSIHAHDCKKIAVYPGHFCAYVPNTASTCDHIFDQCLPTDYWGNKFVVVGTGTQFDDHVRVMPMEDGCQVYKNGVLVQTLNTGQIYDFTLSASNRTAYLETSVPSCVYLFMGSAGTQNGDPSMVVINPVQQMVKNITFGTYSTQYTNTHFVNIVALATEMPNILFDNNPVTSYPVTGNSLYHHAKLEINQGAHTIRTTGDKGFLAYAYGIGSHESYGYSVGSSMTYLRSATLHINNTIIREGDTIYLCEGTPLKTFITINNVVDTFEWHVDGQDAGMNDTLSIPNLSAGIHEFFAHINDTVIQPCRGISYNFDISFVVVVYPNYVSYRHDTITSAQLPWNFHGLYFDSVSNDSIHLSTRHGCDSLIIYSLTLYEDTLYEDYFDTICIGNNYDRYGFFLSGEETEKEGDFIYIKRNDNHVSRLHLTQLAPPELRIVYDYQGDSCFVVTAITNADSLLWTSIPMDSALIGQRNQQSISVCPEIPTTYCVNAFFTRIPDCSSQKKVELLNRIGTTSGEIWVPNVFTPERDDNRFFKVFGYGISEFEISIFHRWGTIAYHSKDIEETWDGTKNGVKCQSGTYTYIIRYKSIYSPNEQKIIYGTVTLLR